jgi:predicted RNase H-like nuclease (RuvC/YqgF family)
MGMATDVTREEFQHLQACVSAVEQEVEGEKMVTRHILEQSRRNGDDLAAIRSRLEGVDGRFDGLERKFDNLERRFDGLERKVGGLERQMDGFRKDLPTIVADVMRDVLSERDKRR